LAKKYKCTHNDMATSVLSLAMKDYFQDLKKDPALAHYEVPESIRINSPVSIREPVKTIPEI